ncbi:hypothetical protein HY498_05780 [Candidatus Woesearchaeota archaeon]|nr:hypothetical protein [Candidatus Woesearchaeota archaeon]
MHKLLRHKDYYEAIIQLRPRDKEIEDYVERRIKKRGIIVPKRIEKKFGVDIYVDSKDFAREIARRLKKAFNGEIKMSSAVHKTERWTSKVLTRLTICFRKKV